MGSNYPTGTLEFSVKLWALPHKFFYYFIIGLSVFFFLHIYFEHFFASVKVYSFHPNSNLFEAIYSYF